jgi:siroheme synthase
MTPNLTSVKSFLGKYYPELNYAAAQDKYSNTGLDSLFEQRFLIQNNKVQMIVDPGLTGLVATITGNEIHISKEFFDHPGVLVTNSLENPNLLVNPRSYYNPEIFPTLAYLMCQNHITFQIVGEIDQPIYIKYKSDFETCYGSVAFFDISPNIEIEIVEEIESSCAAISVVNYTLQQQAKLHLTTFYQSNISATSMIYRNVTVHEAGIYNHAMMGKGAANVIDENRVVMHHNSIAELIGVVNSANRRFHTLLYIQPTSDVYSVSVNYKEILQESAKVTFLPVVLGQVPGENTKIDVSNISVTGTFDKSAEMEVKKYVTDIIDRTILARMIGVKRFYDNKAKFLQFP